MQDVPGLLAYADVLVLLTNEPNKLQKMLDINLEKAGWMELHFNVS